ncbi:DUF2335 domain-containing protein [Pseudazoarcus pumilus]|uniref:DUF2335 domain-containing protein n=1 Tax=Pseudazoarcus pumilus TaxID=2067960 RepID=A0A2I6S9F0_9RHOO|nr:hypothetical protein C0099_13670 [Pseudazoarcus pumilus]
MTKATWSGPLPPPECLERFDAIAPGAAERILKMAEDEQAHRLRCESEALTENIQTARVERIIDTRGQWLGAGLSLAAVVGAVWLALATGAVMVPLALLGLPLMGVARALIIRKGKRE